MSIKPVKSLAFKRDCLAAWERKVAEGFGPEQIIDAYAACEERYGRYLKVFDLFRNPSRGLERAQEETLTTGAMPFGGRLP